MNKILIANRGEIALRIIRSARKMGIQTVAVYSDADRAAPHVRYAHESYFLGDSPPKESYLSVEKIVETALRSGADAIHPGYGFLSENYLFAKSVHDAGLVFIGPSPEAMKMMGDKISAKLAARRVGVPLVPGTEEPARNVAIVIEKARSIGFPLLIKAAGGGGGKGMRVVFEENKLEEEIQRAMSEAQNAFGVPEVFIEKFFTSPRHIEFQILADMHGNIVHLFERECSIQRRHQKVIEEAPSSFLTDSLRKKMGGCAINIARSCGYTNAGTVEFLVDDSGRGDPEFYFLEMNTRLQVEHPVTEMITGLDLVKEQIRIARGEKLSFSQEDLSIRGHAIESRIYAEDPENNFFPSTGKLGLFVSPSGPGIRCDSGYEAGMEIPVYYDPLIAKLITCGMSREEAVSGMFHAINDFEISGVDTTLPFCRFVMKHPDFLSGKYSTDFITKNFLQDFLYSPLTADEEDIAAVSGFLFEEYSSASSSLPARQSPWSARRKEYR